MRNLVLKNISKKTIISTDIKKASSIIDQLFGLLLKDNQAMLFNTRFGIHTFGMKKKIDILVLDSDFRVIKIKENFLPNRLFFWNPKYSLLFELPMGSIKNSNTQVGDRLVV